MNAPSMQDESENTEMSKFSFEKSDTYEYSLKEMLERCKKLRDKVLGSIIFNFYTNIDNLKDENFVPASLSSLHKLSSTNCELNADSIKIKDKKIAKEDICKYQTILSSYLRKVGDYEIDDDNEVQYMMNKKLITKDHYLKNYSEILHDMYITKNLLEQIKNLYYYTSNYEINANINNSNSIARENYTSSTDVNNEHNISSHSSNNYNNNVVQENSGKDFGISNFLLYSFTNINDRNHLNLILDDYIMTSWTIGQKPLVNTKFISHIIQPRIFNIIDDSFALYPSQELNETLIKSMPPLDVTKNEVLKDKNNKMAPANRVNKSNSLSNTSNISKHTKHKKKVSQRRKYRTASSTNGDSLNAVVVPYSPCAPTHIEHIKYSEIITPQWKKFVPGSQIVHPSSSAFSNETISEKNFVDRHIKYEQEEHSKYMLALQMGRRYRKRQTKSSKLNSTKMFDKHDSLKNYEDANMSTNITLYNEDSVSQLF